jgi:Enoyl-CoA hydratase/carnithine racemase
VNGHCLGYGLTLVCGCDFVVASDRAHFGFPEVTLGLPTMVGAIRLPTKIGWQRAMELLLTGERIDASRAREIGLAGWVVPHEDLLAEARRLAGRLLAAAPLAARATKEMAWRGQQLPWTEAVRMGETMRRLAAGTADAQEAATARREGRPPEWTGR